MNVLLAINAQIDTDTKLLTSVALLSVINLSMKMTT